jgi:hypothetical protein
MNAISSGCLARLIWILVPPAQWIAGWWYRRFDRR